MSILPEKKTVLTLGWNNYYRLKYCKYTDFVRRLNYCPGTYITPSLLGKIHFCSEAMLI